jgi:nucleoside-diphosphate-sugar epimerase
MIPGQRHTVTGSSATGIPTLMRVGFNAYLLSHPSLRGWNRYTVNLLAALPAHRARLVERAHLQADVTRLRELLGWTPHADLHRGLSELLHHEGLL